METAPRGTQLDGGPEGGRASSGGCPRLPGPPKNPPPPTRGVLPSSPQHNLVPQPPQPKYVHPSDELILEDELQRIKLLGNVEVAKLVTGRARRWGRAGLRRHRHG